MPREWDTPIRQRWNSPIHQILKAIDNHTHIYLLTRDSWHLVKAQMLRDYVSELKTWIHEQEEKVESNSH